MKLTKSSIQAKDLVLLDNLKTYANLDQHQKSLLHAIIELSPEERGGFLLKLNIRTGEFEPISVKRLRPSEIYRLNPGTKVKELKEAIFPKAKKESNQIGKENKPYYIEFDIHVNNKGGWYFIQDGVRFNALSAEASIDFGGYLYGNTWYMHKVYWDVAVCTYTHAAYDDRETVRPIPSKIRLISTSYKIIMKGCGHELEL